MAEGLHDPLVEMMGPTGFAFGVASTDMSSGSRPIFTIVGTLIPSDAGQGPMPRGAGALLRTGAPLSAGDGDNDPARLGAAAVGGAKDGPVDDGGGGDPPPAPPFANLHFQLKSVTFNIDHGTIVSDPYSSALPGLLTFTPYSDHQWLDNDNDGNADNFANGDRRWPAMTIVGQPLKVNEVTFRVWGDNPNQPWPATLPQASVKGTVSGNDVPPGMILTNDDPMVNFSFDMSGNEFISFHTLSSHAVTFDHVAKIYDAAHATDLRIDWSVIVPNNYTYGGGASKNVFYVTWRDNTLPNGGNDWPRRLFHSVVDISTVGAAGSTAATDEATVFLGVWTRFTGRDVHKVNGPLADQGAALTYYHDYRTTNDETATLLYATDGRCYSWAHILIDCARAQGVWAPADAPQSNFIEIRLSDSLSARDDVTGDLGWGGFLVKGWAFPAAPPQGFTYPYNLLPADRTTFFGAHQYNWRTPPAPQVDQAGAGNLPGQSEPKPQSLFVNHIIVKYGEDWYDPSYGVAYHNMGPGTFPAQFAAAAVVGYWRENRTLLPNDPDVGEFSQTIPRNMTPNQAFKIITSSY